MNLFSAACPGALLALALATSCGTAAAQERPLAIDSNPASGREVLVYWAGSARNADCLQAGLPQISITTPPASGTARVAKVLVTFKAGACSSRAVRVSGVLYRSKPGFKGKDAFSIDVRSNTGRITSFVNGSKTVTVNVR